MTKKPEHRTRDYFTTEQKHEVAAAVLSRKVTFEAAKTKYGLQTYQLEQWLGKYAYSVAMKNPDVPIDQLLVSRNDTPDDNLDHTQTIVPGSNPSITQILDLAQLLGAWANKNRS